MVNINNEIPILYTESLTKRVKSMSSLNISYTLKHDLALSNDSIVAEELMNINSLTKYATIESKQAFLNFNREFLNTVNSS